MSSTPDQVDEPRGCNCVALRRGARQVTSFYDQRLAPSGLRTTQYSILHHLLRLGAQPIQRFAEAMAMDRTTMTRALKPLEREGLIVMGAGKDGRTRALEVTAKGRARLSEAAPLWEQAQSEFEASFGATESAELRRILARLAGAL